MQLSSLQHRQISRFLALENSAGADPERTVSVHNGEDPDNVQDALKLLFAKFAEFHSERQVRIWLRDEGIELPVKAHNPEADGVVWQLPAYNTVHNILTNPIYAGAYAFGRTTSEVSVENGRRRVRRGVRRTISECDVLIKDHHEGYISWEEFERN